MAISKEEERDLERAYRERRAAILNSKTSWEVKMREIKLLHDHYRRRLEGAPRDYDKS